MSINRQDSRHRIKRSNLTGVEPTAHTASTDFTDGTWLNTDIREGEFFYNIPDVRLWVGTGTSSREIEFVGGTAGAESLSDTLIAGNIVPTNQIITGESYSYISMGEGGFESSIAIVSGDTSGVDYSSLITNPKSIELNSYGNITLQSVDLSDTTSISMTPSNLSIISPGVILSTSPIEVSNNCTNNTTYQTGVFSSSAVIANTEIIAQDLGSTSSSVIVRADGSIGIKSQSITDSYINLTPLNIDIRAEDLVMNAASAIYMDSDTFVLELVSDSFTNEMQINCSDTIGLTFSKIILRNEELKFQLNNITETKIGAKIQTSAAGTYSLSTITNIFNDEMVMVKGYINGYSSTPNRVYSATFHSAFDKYGGTVYLINSSISEIENMGDGTTVSIGTDGTSIILNVVPNNSNTTKWITIYEYNKNSV